MSERTRGELLAEGKAKMACATSDDDKVIFYFKDDATTFNRVEDAYQEIAQRVGAE